MAQVLDQPQAKDEEYRPRGGAEKLFLASEPEVLLEGPAGTGKTRSCLEKAYWFAETYPGCRILFVRLTRQSMNESVLQTWEEEVLPQDHPYFAAGPQDRKHRFSYNHPNSSTIVVGGLDNPREEHGHRIMSTTFDMAFVFEATEVRETDYSKLLTRIRPRRGGPEVPYRQIVCDCNPAHPGHWLNRRANEGRSRRILSRHRDNPMLWDEIAGDWTHDGKLYIQRLDSLTSILRKRLRDGLWVAAEGVVYETYDPAIHIVEQASLPASFKRVVASKDWGYTSPGTTHVWGFDGDGRMYLIAEVYRTRKAIDWWIRVDQVLQHELKIERFIADPSEPGLIRLYRNAGLRIEPGDNDIVPGIRQVEQRLAPCGDGKPRIMFVRGCLRHRDPVLAAEGKSLCIHDEFGNYSWGDNPRPGRRNDDEVPLDVENHAMDTMRYAVRWADGHGAIAITVRSARFDELRGSVAPGRQGGPPPDSMAAKQQSFRRKKLRLVG